MNRKSRKTPAKSSAKSKSPGSVRIISGRWRGMKLPVLDAAGLRPTTDRVKETVFNWLMHDLVDAQCLDCFAGSGSLGFEALSRYARHITLIEKDKSAARQLSDNAKRLSSETIDVINADSLSWLAQPATVQFDLIFIDPPFRMGLAEQTITLLDQHGWLANDARVYIEVETELTQLDLPASWSLLKEKTAGQATGRLYAVTRQN